MGWDDFKQQRDGMISQTSRDKQRDVLRHTTPTPISQPPISQPISLQNHLSIPDSQPFHSTSLSLSAQSIAPPFLCCATTLSFSLSPFCRSCVCGVGKSFLGCVCRFAVSNGDIKGVVLNINPVLLPKKTGKAATKEPKSPSKATKSPKKAA